MGRSFSHPELLDRPAVVKHVYTWPGLNVDDDETATSVVSTPVNGIEDEISVSTPGQGPDDNSLPDVNVPDGRKTFCQETPQEYERCRDVLMPMAGGTFMAGGKGRVKKNTFFKPHHVHDLV